MVVLAVCFVLLVVVLFFIESVKVDTQDGKSNLNERGDDFDANPDDIVLGGNGEWVGGSGDVGWDVGGEVGSGGLVLNVSEFECGFYFEEYGVCAGMCPDGVCVSEGRSCYCKS